MDIFEAIAKRHSYRGPFTDQPIPREDLRKIVEAGIHAPSAMNEQVVSMVIVDDPKLLAAVAEVVQRVPCDTAKALIVCVMDPRPVFANVSFAVEDCAAAVENMFLAATALGYGTVWLDGVLRRGAVAAEVGQILGVPPDKNVQVLLPLGVPAQPASQREKRPFEQRAWFNRYGA